VLDVRASPVVLGSLATRRLRARVSDRRYEADDGDPVTWLLLLLALLFETAPEDDPDADPDDEEVRDPIAKIRSLTEANARLARQKRKAEERLAELEEPGTPKPTDDGARTTRLENAFLRTAIEGGTDLDLDTAWTLLEGKGLLDLVTVTDEGAVEGMDAALERLLDRYPWLSHEPPEVEPTAVSGAKAPPPKKKRDPNAIDESAIRDRFPQLKRRRSEWLA